MVIHHIGTQIVKYGIPEFSSRGCWTPLGGRCTPPAPTGRFAPDSQLRKAHAAKAHIIVQAKLITPRRSVVRYPTLLFSLKFILAFPLTSVADI
jgi:hypothetical protein